MVGFSSREKRELVHMLGRLRNQKRKKGLRVTFTDIEKAIWDLPAKQTIWGQINNFMTKLQGKKQLKDV